MTVFDRIIASRGLTSESLEVFLHPEYDSGHDPFLLPDMDRAVERLVAARAIDEHITIYGDYDIDGLTASTVLVDALTSFGFTNVEVFIPNRFVEGYGMTIGAVDKIAETGTTLIITVDCGSLSEREIIYASEKGIDVIVTDHHNVAPVQPPAVAVINPKRFLQDYPEQYDGFILNRHTESDSDFSGAVTSSQANSGVTSSAPAELGQDLKQSSVRDEVTSDLIGLSEAPEKFEPNSIRSQSSSAPSSNSHLPSSEPTQPPTPNPDPPPTTYHLPPTNPYPFLDLPGVGVAFKFVQALQTRLDGLEKGQEKWLLDLVALGTVCDVVTLQDENRMHVYWGLEVMKRSRRPGLKALMAVAGIEPEKLNARSLGFGLGPRMNAAGRLETAQYTLDMLLARDGMSALDRAQKLDEMNTNRRKEQDAILKDALVQAEQRAGDSVLVVSQAGWNHGIIGIVAAKLLERFKKPTYVLEEMGEEAKGSARSYGDFSAVDAIRASDDIITKGGGHRLAAGVTMPTANISAFRQRVNDHYTASGLAWSKQRELLLPREDTTAELAEITEDLVAQIDSLEPFGNGNERPVIKTKNLLVQSMRRMGSDGQHVKLSLSDGEVTMDFLAFNADDNWFVESGNRVDIWYQPEINEWRGRRSVEGRLVHLTERKLHLTKY